MDEILKKLELIEKRLSKCEELLNRIHQDTKDSPDNFAKNFINNLASDITGNVLVR